MNKVLYIYCLPPKAKITFKKNSNVKLQEMLHIIYGTILAFLAHTVQKFLNGIHIWRKQRSESFVDEKRLVMTSRFCRRNSSSIVSIFLRDIHPSFSKIATLFEVSPTVSFSFLRILAKAHSWTTTHCFEFCPKKLLKPCSKT